MSHRYIVRNGERSAFGKRSPTDPTKKRGVAPFPVPDHNWQLTEWRQALGHPYNKAPERVDVELYASIGRMTLRLAAAKLPAGFVTKIRTITRPKK